MENKKKSDLSLEKRRKYFFQLGLVIGLGFSLVAFEWTQFQTLPDVPKERSWEDDFDTEIIPITVQNATKPVELPEPKKNPIILNPIDNKVEPEPNKNVSDPSNLPDPSLLPFSFDPFDEEEEKDMDIVVDWASEMPEFIGGDEALQFYLHKNLKYPPIARDVGAQGTVLVSFVIDKDGNVSDVKVAQDRVGFGAAEEAVRVVQNMPRWKPGRQGSNPVSVRLGIPVNFILR
jgi:protein TonB